VYLGRCRRARDLLALTPEAGLVHQKPLRTTVGATLNVTGKPKRSARSVSYRRVACNE
jgi:uncharacterized lipoprotein YajG